MKQLPFSCPIIDATGGQLLAAPPVLEKIHYLLDYLGISIEFVKLVDNFWELTLRRDEVEMIARLSDQDANTLQVPDAHILVLVYNIFMSFISQMTKLTLIKALQDD